MKTIYKYSIKIDNNGVCIINLPKNAKILKVTKFNNQQDVCLWALIEKDETETIQKVFKIFGTGHLIEDVFNGKYIDTFCVNEFVFHIFEISI